MTDTPESLTPLLLNTVQRMGERVSSLETKADGLGEDTQVIRKNIHDINNRLVELLGCTEKLSITLSERAEELKRMSSEIRDLAALRNKWNGVWWAIVRVCSVVVGAFMVMSGIGALLGWLLSHHASLSVQ